MGQRNFVQGFVLIRNANSTPPVNLHDWSLFQMIQACVHTAFLRARRVPSAFSNRRTTVADVHAKSSRTRHAALDCATNAKIRD